MNKARIMQYTWLFIGLFSLVLMIIQIVGSTFKESIPMGIVCILAIIFYFVRRKQAKTFEDNA